MNAYLDWLASSTQSVWWNDSADAMELACALEHGACGVTTNPVLVARTLSATPVYWGPILGQVSDAIERLRLVTVHVAQKFTSIYEATAHKQGYVCAQVDPRHPGDREVMLAQARQFRQWAPNIAVKLPATAAGHDVLEECVAEGITVVSTVSYTVPQVFSAARRHQLGAARACAAGITPGRLFAVVMVGRLDDYLREVAHDNKIDIPEEYIIQAGTAVMKRAYKIFQEEQFDAMLMPAGMRGSYHAEALAGGLMAMSIHPSIQSKLAKLEQPFVKRIDEPVEEAVLGALDKIPGFRQACEPDGMRPEDFITYGVVQKTLAQFVENFIRI